MTHVEERRIGDLTVQVDRLICVGFGDCVEAAPDVWEMGDDGIVTFRDPLPPLDRETLLLSCDVCPVDALTVLTADGERLVP